MRIILITISLVFLTSCQPLAWLGQIFKKPNQGGGGGYYGPSYGAGEANRWLNQNTSPPDMSCSGRMLQANAVKIAPDHGGAWKKEWTDGLLQDMDNHPYSQVLEDGLFSESYQDKIGCPAYKRLNREQRKRIVIHQLAEVCRPESGFNPALRYSECGSGSCWTNIGLCQMIKKTVNLPAYGCNLKSSSDLADPRKHLRCALLVMNHNMRKKCGGSFPCSGTYWGPMRKAGKVRGMVANTRAHINRLHPYCKTENWNGLDRRSFQTLGEQSDSLNSNCQTVEDKGRGFPSKGSPDSNQIMEKSNETSTGR